MSKYGKRPIPANERFWEKVPNRPPSPELCWEWRGCFGGGRVGDYPRFEANGPLAYAHRAAWVLTGSEIPEGMEIDHACRNPACVRPGHLSVVEPEYNSEQGRKTRNARWLAATHCKRGHARSAENVYLHGGQRPCRICKLERNRRYKKAKR